MTTGNDALKAPDKIWIREACGCDSCRESKTNLVICEASDSEPTEYTRTDPDTQIIATAEVDAMREEIRQLCKAIEELQNIICEAKYVLKNGVHDEVALSGICKPEGQKNKEAYDILKGGESQASSGVEWNATGTKSTFEL